MKVVCIHENIDDNLAEEINLQEGKPRFYDLIKNKEYVVLGLSYFLNSDNYAYYPVVEIKNDLGGMTSAPLFLFQVIDDTPSKYWHIKFDQEGKSLRMWPESFHNDFYHDDLSEEVPKVKSDFIKVCKLLEDEYKGKEK